MSLRKISRNICVSVQSYYNIFLVCKHKDNIRFLNKFYIKYIFYYHYINSVINSVLIIINNIFKQLITFRACIIVFLIEIIKLFNKILETLLRSTNIFFQLHA